MDALMKGAEVSDQQSWEGPAHSKYTSHTFLLKPSTLASRAEPLLAIVWSYHFPDEHLLGTQAALFLKYAKCPPYPELSHWPLLLLSLLFCLNPSPGLPPILGLVLCSRSLQSDLPFLPASQNISPADSPSIPFGLFYFSAHHCPTFNVFFALSVSSHQNTSSKSVETDFVHFGSLVTTTAEARHTRTDVPQTHQGRTESDMPQLLPKLSGSEEIKEEDQQLGL